MTEPHAASMRLRFAMLVNLVFAVLAAWVLVLACTTMGGRAPAGAVVGVPLLIAQMIFGTVPALVLVRVRRGRAAARSLIALALVGPAMTTAAVILSLLTCGGC